MTSKPSPRRRSRQYEPARPGWRPETVEPKPRVTLSATLRDRMIEKSIQRAERARGDD